MGNPAISENIFLLYSFGVGIFITFVYDLFRIWRRVWVHNRFFISLEDLIFWIFCAMVVFYMMHTQSNGTLRWFAILGALLGMFLYKKTISAFLVKWVSFCLRAVFRFFGRILGIVGRPFRFVGKKTVNAGKKAAGGSRRVLKYLKKKLTGSLKMLRIILCKH